MLKLLKYEIVSLFVVAYMSVLIFTGCVDGNTEKNIKAIKESSEIIKSPDMRPLMYECYTDVCFIDFKWLDMKTDTEKVSRFYIFNTNKKHKLHNITHENYNYAYNVYFKRVDGKSVLVMAELLLPYRNEKYEYLF